MIDVNKLFFNVLNDVISIGAPISTKIIPTICIDEDRYDRVGACYRYKSPERYEIHLSSDTLRADESEIKSIIAHEILHTCHLGMEHDGIWNIYRNKMNNCLGYNIQIEYSWKKIINI